MLAERGLVEVALLPEVQHGTLVLRLLVAFPILWEACIPKPRPVVSSMAHEAFTLGTAPPLYSSWIISFRYTYKNIYVYIAPV